MSRSAERLSSENLMEPAFTLDPGCHVMGLTPFDEAGRIDESALREHVEWMADERIAFWPASPATGEGVQMNDDELFRVLAVSVEAMAGRFPVVASNREYPTAAQNIEYVVRAQATGADAVQLYPPTLGHSATPTGAMLERFYDDVLSAVEAPIVLSSNFMTGFEIPSAVIAKALDTYPHIVGVFKHHPDQQNVAQFVQRFAPRTTVLTMSQRSLFAAAVGSHGELDNLQNIAPRLCRTLHDAVHAGDATVAAESYAKVTRLWASIMAFSADFQAPRVVVYKAILSQLGREGWNARAPYVELPREALSSLARLVDDIDLRVSEGLA